jgi:RNA polymerase sigma-70 factor (ECF subfamily)
MQSKRAGCDPSQGHSARQAMIQRTGGEQTSPASSANPARSSEARRPLDEVDASWLAAEPDALNLAHDRYRVRLEAVALRIVGNHADAEDVVQKIFIALGGASFRGESSLWTYLYRSAVNGAVNVLRAKRRRENAEKRLLEHELLDSTLRPGPDNTVLEGEIMAAVATALLHVKPQHRRVLTLRIMHGLNNTEIAERENLPLPTVGTWLRRGREELRRGLRPLMKELGAGRQ